ncbi:MAG: DNA repair protein RadA [bacterium]|nr:DNA repair protein RadA [bacterium]
MSKPTLLFECSTCGAQTPKWAGRCFECGGWGTLGQTVSDGTPANLPPVPSANAVPFSEIESSDIPRIPTHISELDQVLGGGIVPGSLILIGGEPGIGKSTLLLQIAIRLAEKQNQILYASGEESGQQIKMRLDRLSTEPNVSKKILYIGETNTEKICASIVEQKPRLAIVDSIQTIRSNDVQSEAGSINQVRASTMKLLETAKQHHIPIIIAGHVTKEGMVAGPKMLEHMVDTVLYLEGDNQYHFRLLKTVKNRFGSTNELGVFEMTEEGLREVSNPSDIFLSSNKEPMPGSVTSVIMEGSRAFLVQVQALTSKTYFGYPQRRAVGFDTNRLQLLIAVLSKRLGLNLGDQDIHLNIVGGFKINEPAVDLAVCAAIMSGYKNVALPADQVIFGEVGLNGEVRPISHADRRLKEASKLGFQTAVCPKASYANPPITVQQIQSLKEFEI